MRSTTAASAGLESYGFRPLVRRQIRSRAARSFNTTTAFSNCVVGGRHLGIRSSGQLEPVLLPGMVLVFWKLQFEEAPLYHLT